LLEQVREWCGELTHDQVEDGAASARKEKELEAHACAREEHMLGRAHATGVFVAVARTRLRKF